MIVRRSLRRLVSLAAAVAIVAAQSAAAAYACARTEAAAVAAAAAVPCPEHARAAAGAGQGSPNLCEIHCQDGSVPSLGLSAIAPAPEPALDVPAPIELAEGRLPPSPEAKGAAPPARSLYCRLQL